MSIHSNHPINITSAHLTEPLRLILDLINTTRVEGGIDTISAPSRLTTWLQSHNLISADAWLTVEDVARVIGFRESLRALTGTNIGIPLSAHALEVLNRTAKASSLAVAFLDTGVGRLEPVRYGVDGAVGWILAAVATSMADGSWYRLKLCGNPRCRWAFFDRSKNRSRVWCAMAACGNRSKVMAYRKRQGKRGDSRQVAGPEGAAGLPRNRTRMRGVL